MEPWREHNYDQPSQEAQREQRREEYPESLSRPPTKKQLAQKPEGKGSWETSSPVIQRRQRKYRDGAANKPAVD